MARTYSFDLVRGMAIARLYTLTQVNQVVTRLTDWDVPIKIGSDTWYPAVGLVPFDIGERNDGTPASTSLSLAVYSGGVINPQDLDDGLFDEMLVEIDLCNPRNPIARHFEFYGEAGSNAKPVHGVVTFDLRNPHGFSRRQLVETFGVMCGWPFGGTFCGHPVMAPDVARGEVLALGVARRKLTGTSPTGYGNVYFEVTTAGTTHASTVPTYDYTIGNTTTDGSVVFTARNAWERACEIDTVVNRHNLTLTTSPDVRAIDNWYGPGKIMFVTGRDKNRPFKIGAWRASDFQLTTFMPAGLFAAAGDKALIWPDCDKTRVMCNDKYTRIGRFGGIPNFEGAKAVNLPAGG